MMARLGSLVRRGGLGLLFWAVGSDAIHALSNPGDPPEYCTLFNHMVKSGGSIIKDKLISFAIIDGVDRPGKCVNTLGTEQYCLDALNMSPVIIGYAELLRYPLESIGRHCEYFTMMRHPIDRLVSAFFYCPTEGDVQSRPDKWCGDRLDPISLPDRLREFAQYGWKNEAFRQMTFGLYCPPTAFCEQAQPGPQQEIAEPGGWDLLEQIEMILGSYVAVGIMEYWDLSMELFDEKVRSPVEEWKAVAKPNPGERSEARDEMLRWARMSPDIHRALATDVLLYDYAVLMFKQQTQATLGTVWD